MIAKPSVFSMDVPPRTGPSMKPNEEVTSGSRLEGTFVAYLPLLVFFFLLHPDKCRARALNNGKNRGWCIIGQGGEAFSVPPQV